MNKKDFLQKHSPKSESIEVESWGETVKITELTAGQYSQVQAVLVSGIDHDAIESMDGNSISVSTKNVEDAKFMMVSFGLLSPKLSVEELRGMGKSSMDGINEIHKAINDLNSPKK